MNNIQVVRGYRKITQAELAKRTGLARPYLSNLEHGKGKPSIESGIKIAKALGVTLDDLFFTQNVIPELQGLKDSEKEAVK